MAENLISARALLNWHSVLASKYLPDTDLDAAIAAIEQMLSVSNARLQLRDYVQVLEKLSPARAPAWAWEVGTSTELRADSPVFEAILGCSTLGCALYWSCRFFPLLQDGSRLQLAVNGEQATLSYRILDPTIWPRHIDAIYTLGLQARLIRAARQDAWSQVQIIVEAESGERDDRLDAIVQAPVTYGCSVNGIRFPVSLLEAPFSLLKEYNPDLILDLANELTRKERATPVSERTRQLIFAGMTEGRVSQDHIARELGLSSRTLRRRLTGEQQSFQALLDECRLQSAALELRIRDKISLSDMALRLGYTEHSTFSRAFTRWAGMAPRDYRRNVTASQQAAWAGSHR